MTCRHRSITVRHAASNQRANRLLCGRESLDVHRERHLRMVVGAAVRLRGAAPGSPTAIPSAIVRNVDADLGQFKVIRSPPRRIREQPKRRSASLRGRRIHATSQNRFG